MYMSYEEEKNLKNLSDESIYTADGRVINVKAAAKYDTSQYFILKKDLQCEKGTFKKGSLVRFSCAYEFDRDVDTEKDLYIVGVDNDIYSGRYRELGYGVGEPDICTTVTSETFDEYFEKSGEVGSQLKDIVEDIEKVRDKEDSLSFFANGILALAVAATVITVVLKATMLGIFGEAGNWAGTHTIFLYTAIISWIVGLTLYKISDVVITKGTNDMYERIGKWKTDYADIFGYEYIKGLWKIKM